MNTMTMKKSDYRYFNYVYTKKYITSTMVFDFSLIHRFV